MTAPRDTPNAGTSTRPEQSSQRVAHKKPLAWLPWALIAALLLLLLLVFLVVNAVDDDGPDGTAGDSLGQVGGSESTSPSSITTSAQGPDSPVATNDTEEGRQQNRRAAIVARG